MINSIVYQFADPILDFCTCKFIEKCLKLNPPIHPLTIYFYWHNKYTLHSNGIGLNAWNTKFSEFFYGSFYLHVPLRDLTTCYCQKVGSIFHLYCNVQMLLLIAFQRLFISGTVEYKHMQKKNSINKTFFIVV